MKLLTADLLGRLKPITDPGYDQNDPVVHAKFFSPVAKWTWFVTAGRAVEDDYIFFGCVMGDENEWGSFSLSELERVKLPFGLKVERDLHFTPRRFSELADSSNGVILPETSSKPKEIVTNSEPLAPDLSAYTIDELIALDNMMDTIGGALADTFTVNGDARPLAGFGVAMNKLLVKLDRLVIDEFVRRDSEHAPPNRSHVSPTDESELRGQFDTPDYEFKYGKH